MALVPRHLSEHHDVQLKSSEILSTLDQQFAANGISPSEVRTCDLKKRVKSWQLQAKPDGQPHQYIYGLPVFLGAHCPFVLCPASFATKKQMQKHFEIRHKGKKSRFIPQVLLQTFSSAKDLKRYFEISNIPEGVSIEGVPDVAEGVSIEGVPVSPTISKRKLPVEENVPSKRRRRRHNNRSPSLSPSFSSAEDAPPSVYLSSTVSLGFFHLGYNPEHNLLICLKCAAIVFFCSARSHLSKHQCKVPLQRDNFQLYNSLCTHAYAVGPQCQFEIVLETKIRDQGFEPRNCLGYGRLPTPMMVRNFLTLPTKPIEGVRIYKGYGCPYCDRALTSHQSLRGHLQMLHWGEPKPKESECDVIAIQCISWMPRYNRFFEVQCTPPNCSSTKEFQSSKPAFCPTQPLQSAEEASIEKEIDSFFNTTIAQSALQLPPPNEMSSIHPFLQTAHVDEFLKDRPRDAIFALCNPPPKHQWFKRMMSLQPYTFDIDIQISLQLNPSLRWQIAASNP